MSSEGAARELTERGRTSTAIRPSRLRRRRPQSLSLGLSIHPPSFVQACDGQQRIAPVPPSGLPRRRPAHCHRAPAHAVLLTSACQRPRGLPPASPAYQDSKQFVAAGRGGGLNASLPGSPWHGWMRPGDGGDGLVPRERRTDNPARQGQRKGPRKPSPVREVERSMMPVHAPCQRQPNDGRRGESASTAWRLS